MQKNPHHVPGRVYLDFHIMSVIFHIIYDVEINFHIIYDVENHRHDVEIQINATRDMMWILLHF